MPWKRFFAESVTKRTSTADGVSMYVWSILHNPRIKSEDTKVYPSLVSMARARYLSRSRRDGGGVGTAVTLGVSFGGGMVALAGMLRGTKVADGVGVRASDPVILAVEFAAIVVTLAMIFPEALVGDAAGALLGDPITGAVKLGVNALSVAVLFPELFVGDESASREGRPREARYMARWALRPYRSVILSVASVMRFMASSTVLSPRQ